MYVPNLKSVAFPVPEIIGGTPKNWGVHVYAFPFLENFSWAFVRMGLVYVSAEFEEPGFTHS